MRGSSVNHGNGTLRDEYGVGCHICSSHPSAPNSNRVCMKSIFETSTQNKYLWRIYFPGMCSVIVVSIHHWTYFFIIHWNSISSFTNGHPFVKTFYYNTTNVSHKIRYYDNIRFTHPYWNINRVFSCVPLFVFRLYICPLCILSLAWMSAFISHSHFSSHLLLQ